MQAVAYEPKRHEGILSAWLQRHGLEPNLVTEIPALGIVVEDAESAIAAGFLRTLEGGFLLLDGLIADPQSHGKRRYQALDLVVSSLIAEARQRGVLKLLAMSKDKATLKRSIRHGFVLLPEKLIGMSLEKG